MAETTTIEISIELKDKLHRIKQALENLTSKSLSYDKTLKIILCCKPIDQTLEDLILAEKLPELKEDFPINKEESKP